MNKLLSFLFVLLSALELVGQDFSITNFQRLDTDLDARMNYPIKDHNGKLCAILKIDSPVSDLAFETGSLSIVDRKDNTGQIWLYVQPGIRKITIAHKTLGVLREWCFPIVVEPGYVYNFKIKINENVTKKESNEESRRLERMAVDYFNSYKKGWKYWGTFLTDTFQHFCESGGNLDPEILVDGYNPYFDINGLTDLDVGTFSAKTIDCDEGLVKVTGKVHDDFYIVEMSWIVTFKYDNLKHKKLIDKVAEHAIISTTQKPM